MGIWMGGDPLSLVIFEELHIISFMHSFLRGVGCLKNIISFRTYELNLSLIILRCNQMVTHDLKDYLYQQLN